MPAELKDLSSIEWICGEKFAFYVAKDDKVGLENVSAIQWKPFKPTSSESRIILKKNLRLWLQLFFLYTNTLSQISTVTFSAALHS